jgi:hypothetical protein
MGKGEAVVDAGEGRNVIREFVAKPFGKATPRPVPPWAEWRPKGFRVAGALGDVNPKPHATGFGSHGVGVVDGDVAFELGRR